MNLPQPSNALANAIAQLTGDAPPSPTSLVNSSAKADGPRAVEGTQPSGVAVTQPPSTVPAGKAVAAADDSAKSQARASSSVTDKIKTGLFGKATEPAMPVAEARLMPAGQEMRVGEKQRIALVLISKEPLGSAITRLHFDPRVLAVRAVSPGPWADGAGSQPTIMQSIDPAGLIALAISAQAGAPIKAGANVVLFLEVEALAPGESVISFDENAQASASDGRGVKLQMTESRVTVK
jgi:hypothetical protein